MRLLTRFTRKVQKKIGHLRLRWQRLSGHLPWLLRLRRDDGSMKREAGTVVDLLATIIASRKFSNDKDYDAALAILHYTFPEVEHSWIAERFEKALSASYTIDEVLLAAAAGRDESERMAMAIEVLSLLLNASESGLGEDLFDRVTLGLELPGAAPELIRLLTVPGTEAADPAFSVSFATADHEHDVTLSDKDEGISFRLIRCSSLVLIINDGPKAFTVRGRLLKQGAMTPLTTGQVALLPSGALSYEDFSFILEAKRTGRRDTYYMFLEAGSLQITRVRTRNVQFRVTIGLRCSIELLRPDILIRVHDQELTPNEKVELTYHDEFSVNEEGPFSLNQIKSVVSDIGKQFQIDPELRRVRVTNLPEKAKKGDLLLTPGLAPGAVFEVSFSREANSGTIKVIEENFHILVNNKIVKGEMELSDGDVIKLNAYQGLRCNFESGVLDEEYNAIRSLSVESITKDFARAGRVVDNIDFELKRGEIACVLGPSGSGKSTLLSILAGHLLPTRGRVRYNDQSLYDQPDRLRPYIAYIPREDILDAAMTVSEHIAQATVIRRPRLLRPERMRRVNATLKFLGLNHIASRRVGGPHARVISDGERTRLNLGLDLAGVADVFLLDEPISGLSSSDASKVMETLERLKKDKIVIATMHRPSASILNRFDKVLVLDHGGQMAYWGTPGDMLLYFKKAASELGIQVSVESIQSGGADYVFEVLEAPLRWYDGRRLQHPQLWQERYEGFRFRNSIGTNLSLGAPRTLVGSNDVIPPQPRRKMLQLWALFRLWVTRTFLGRVRSQMGLYTTLLEAPLLALLIAITLRASSTPDFSFKTALHIPPYLFLSAVVAMFFGLTGAASEILKDRPMLRRESNYRVFVTGYILAKALVLTFLCSIQSLLYLIVGNAILHVEEMLASYWLIMILTAFVGVSISLLVSVFAKTERVALNLVPLILVPQVLLAGAMIPFEEMNQFIPWSAHRADESGRLKPGRIPLVAEFCPLRYSYEMFVVDSATNNIWEIERSKIQKKLDELKNKPGRLSQEESEKLKLLRTGLAAISSCLEAPSADKAKQTLRDIRRKATNGDPLTTEEMQDFLAGLEREKGNTLTSYYVNDRILGIFESAEAIRQSRETTDRPSIFLAKNQPCPGLWDGKEPDDPGYSADQGTVPTLWKDGIVLFLMGGIPLIISGLRLKRKLDVRKTKRY